LSSGGEACSKDLGGIDAPAVVATADSNNRAVISVQLTSFVLYSMCLQVGRLPRAAAAAAEPISQAMLDTAG